MTGLRGQVAVVTGGGKGLGRAFALDLAARGVRVVVNNRNRQVDEHGAGPADHVVAEIEADGGEAVAEHSDVTDPDVGSRLVELAMATWGRLDICVTSAGVSNPELFHRSTREQFATVLDTNVLGTMSVVAACSVAMRAAGHGRIVLVSSGAGLHGEPTASAYAASKGAVIALGRTIAVEGARRGVLTNVLLPYATTQMTEAGMDRRYATEMRPELVAPVVSALVDPACELNGQVLVAAGGVLRATDSVEWATVPLPDSGEALSPALLADLLDRSRAGQWRRYDQSIDAFTELAGEARTAAVSR